MASGPRNICLEHAAQIDQLERAVRGHNGDAGIVGRLTVLEKSMADLIRTIELQQKNRLTLWLIAIEAVVVPIAVAWFSRGA